VFDSAPTAGATISVDYTTPRGDAVDWSSAATMGEDTTSDGTISVGESSSKDGVFNDFFSSHTQDTITISQPNRGVSMTLAVNPTWTINQFIDEFNIEAQVSDVEAEAYWDGTAGEVRIRPGTSGWKTRDITGWAGEYFKLEGAVVSPNATNLGGGSSGAQATAQNRFSIEETTAAVGSRIIVRTADGTVLADSTSDWNHHDLTNLSFSLDILESATVGATSQFFVQAAQLQIGGGADDASRMYLHMPDIRARSLDIESVDLRRQPLAVSALNKIDNAISSANGFRAYFGSQINNLTHQMDAITVFEHNTTAAETQIRDVDFAQASAELSRTQVLIQSSLAMVAQGNMSRQSVLQLLDF
jgi:flagellin-like hook-associated protein FlgL